MKLYEITKVEPTVQHHDTSFDASGPRATEKDFTAGVDQYVHEPDHFAKGLKYKVKDHPEDDSKVRKYTMYPDSESKTEDAFHQYIVQIVNQDTSDNPYVPKVSGMHYDVDREGKQHTTFDVERLVSADRVPFEEAEHYVHTLYPEASDDEIAMILWPYDGEKNAARLTTLYGRRIEELVGSDNLLDNINDPHLVQTVIILRNLVAKGATLDLFYIHGDNIMYRDLGGEYQLVINDPLT